MTQQQRDAFHLTIFMFDLDSEELDEIVKRAGLKYETATPEQVREAVRKAIGDEQFYKSLAAGNRRFGYDEEF